MVDYKTPNLVGANTLLNETLTKSESIKNSFKEQMNDVTADASAIKGVLESEVAGLKDKLSSLIPELPEIPNVSAQSDFAALKNLNLQTPAGLENYTSQLSALKDSFGDVLTAGGLVIEDLAGQILEGVDVGSLIPNFQIPDGSTIPIELPANIKVASSEALKEKLTTTPTLSTVASAEALAALRNNADDVELTNKKQPETKTPTSYTVVSTGEAAGISTTKTTTTTVTTSSREASSEVIPPEGGNKKQSTRTYNTLSGVGSRRKYRKYPASYPEYPGAGGKYTGFQNVAYHDTKIESTHKKFNEDNQKRISAGRFPISNSKFDENGDWRKDTNGFLWYDIRYNRKKMVKT